MIGRHIVLVHGLLHQTQTERAGVEGEVLLRLRGDGTEMMDAGQFE
jgi:hypothetical protein